jgi:hypothetical protein
MVLRTARAALRMKRFCTTHTHRDMQAHVDTQTGRRINRVYLKSLSVCGATLKITE